MKARGLEFLTIPDTYYEELREQLKHSKVTVEEDLDVLQVGSAGHECGITWARGCTARVCVRNRRQCGWHKFVYTQ